MDSHSSHGREGGMSNFDRAFEIVVGEEGGYSRDPHDPGGETKYGISKRQYPLLDIAALRLEDAKSIYQWDYWHVIDGDSLPWPLALYVFDAAVNQGKHAAIVLLQRSVGVLEDGIIGPNTRDAIARIPVKELESRYLARRAQRYAETPQFDRYGMGWLTRLFSVSTKGNV